MKKLKDKKSKTSKIILIFIPIFAILILTCTTISIIIFIKLTKKDEGSNNSSETEQNQELAKAILLYPKLNLNVSDTEFQQSILDLEDPVPEKSVESIYIDYDFPKVYLYDKNETLDTNNDKFEKGLSTHGFRYLLNTELIPAPQYQPDYNLEDPIQVFNTANAIQMRAEQDSEEVFRITYFKEDCWIFNDIEWVAKYENVMTRGHKMYGEKNDFYFLGKQKLENLQDYWEKGWVYFQILDDDGEIEDSTIYVVDYFLTDKNGFKYVNTIRGTKDYINENYGDISAMLGSLEPQDQFSETITARCFYEPVEDWKKRLEWNVDKLNYFCEQKSGGECINIHILTFYPNPNNINEDSWATISLEKPSGDYKTLKVEICDNAKKPESRIWTISWGDLSSDKREFSSAEGCVQEEVFLHTSLMDNTITLSYNEDGSIKTVDQQKLKVLFGGSYYYSIKYTFSEDKKISFEGTYKQ